MDQNQDGMEIVDDAAEDSDSVSDISIEVSVASDDPNSDNRDLPEVPDIFDFESVWLSLHDKTGGAERTVFPKHLRLCSLSTVEPPFQNQSVRSWLDLTRLNLSHLRKNKSSVETTN